MLRMKFRRAGSQSDLQVTNETTLRCSPTHAVALSDQLPGLTITAFPKLSSTTVHSTMCWIRSLPTPPSSDPATDAKWPSRSFAVSVFPAPDTPLIRMLWSSWPSNSALTGQVETQEQATQSIVKVHEQARPETRANNAIRCLDRRTWHCSAVLLVKHTNATNQARRGTNSTRLIAVNNELTKYTCKSKRS